MENTNNFYESLLEYFRVTDRETVLSDWKKTESFDKVGIPISEFLYIPDTFVKTIIDEDISKNSLEIIGNVEDLYIAC